jgi:pyruvate dehydrogenase phosphatase
MRSPTGSPWHFWAVIDGHAGWETSAALARRLIPSVSGALRGLYSRKPEPASEDVDQAIKDAFVTLDNEIVYEEVRKVMESGSRDASPETIARAMAGAVAMLTFYDPSLGTAKVALTGDLRAVRGRRGADGRWEVKVLTVEQDGDNEEEANRIRKEHPEEPDVIKDGRVLGYQPTRVFGDASLKWSVNTQTELYQKFLVRKMRDVIKTPPYVTAEPVITTTDIKEGDFLILGCDGIWESLTSQEAVGLIGTWLDEPRSAQSTSSNTLASSPTPTRASVTEGRSWWPLSKKRTEQAPKPAQKGDPVRYPQWRVQKNFVNVDDNAATHLIRNSLGGADKATMKALLTRTGNHARRLR